MDTDRSKQKKIQLWLERIENSDLTISEFFNKHKVPFSRSQYFQLKKNLATSGKIVDGRFDGGNRRLSSQAEGFIKGSLDANPTMSLKMIQSSLKKTFGVIISVSGVSRAIGRLGPQYERQGNLHKRRRREFNSMGGFEIMVAIAYSVGWPARTTKTISDIVSKLKKTKRYKEAGRHSDPLNRKGGRFTSGYNKRKDVRRSRFSSVIEKRATKNWRSMNLVRDSKGTAERKNIALLSLPVVTSNGRVRSVNAALGYTLKHFCGFNYTQSTISKHLAELKYMGASTYLLQDGARFWSELWGNSFADRPLLCYYIDGNTKALWSSMHVRKNKVTMLGRVMGCLEQVFIHDGQGHPIYFETYSGHAPVGEYVLEMLGKIQDVILDVPGKNISVYRALVMDSASNSVRTLRSFAAQKRYHYITPLDDNQWSERQVVQSEKPSRYHYGDAMLTNLEYEMTDSKEKGYLVRTRAVRIDWDNGKRFILLTSLPPFIDASEVVHSYFERWPAQENQFRHKKAVVCLNRIAGYGKTLQDDPKAREKQEKCRVKIKDLTHILKEDLSRIGSHEQALAVLVAKERNERAKTEIRKGKRVGVAKVLKKLKVIGAEISRHKSAISQTEKNRSKEFRSLRKNQMQWLKLQGKEKIYEADVELDQIMTYYRMGLANLYAYFLKNYCNDTPMTFESLVNRIVSLPAAVDETAEERRIGLQYNSKDKELMRVLAKAIEKINKQNIYGPKGKLMKFSIVNDLVDTNL